MDKLADDCSWPPPIPEVDLDVGDSCYPDLTSHGIPTIPQLTMQQAASSLHGRKFDSGQTARANHLLTSGLLSSDSCQARHHAPQPASHGYAHRSEQQDPYVHTSAMGERAAPKLMVGQQERQLLCLLHSLAQPVTDAGDSPWAARLSTLGEINELQGLSARMNRYRNLYKHNLRVRHFWGHLYASPLTSRPGAVFYNICYTCPSFCPSFGPPK